MNIFATYSVEDLLKYGVAILFLVAIVLAVVYMVWGGFMMIISGGNEERVKKAVNHIRYSVLGIVVMVVVILVAPILFGLVGLPYGEYFRPSTVFATIKELSNNIFSNSSDTIYISPNGSLPVDFTNLD